MDLWRFADFVIIPLSEGGAVCGQAGNKVGNVFSSGRLAPSLTERSLRWTPTDLCIPNRQKELQRDRSVFVVMLGHFLGIRGNSYGRLLFPLIDCRSRSFGCVNRMNLHTEANESMHATLPLI